MSVGTSIRDSRKYKKLVLLLDGDSIINYINRRLFLSYSNSWEIVESHNPKHAIEFLKTSNILPELIILDLRLPFMDGWEFMDACRELEIQSNFYILTNEISPEEIKLANQYPQVVGFGEKPLLTEGIENIFTSLREKVN